LNGFYAHKYSRWNENNSDHCCDSSRDGAIEMP
jgi:hypothetical protein